MTEDEAREWVAETFGALAAKQLGRYVALLLAGSEHQNLISETTKSQIWTRHIADSAQLLLHADGSGDWIDIGSGAGLPGIVVAVCSEHPVTLVEPRALRTKFLSNVIDNLGLGSRVDIAQAKSQNYHVDRPGAVISARAVASLDKIFPASVHLADMKTRWILPKGAAAQMEVENARKAWHGVFHVKPSMTDPTSGIVVAQGVRRR